VDEENEDENIQKKMLGKKIEVKENRGGEEDLQKHRTEEKRKKNKIKFQWDTLWIPLSYLVP
jgi:hypothetical protein